MTATNATPGETDLTSLMTTIVGEAKKVIEQESRRLRSELKDELAKGENAAMSLGTGAGAGALGGVLLGLMLVHLVQRTTGIPLWLSYGIIGGLLALGGSGLLAAGVQQVADLPKEAGEALKGRFS